MKRRHFVLLASLFVFGCITPKAHENPKTTEELRTILQDFHMKLRWQLWDQAASYATDDYRNEFLGRYEELGEDFKIVNLEIKTVTLDDPISTVDVEQESYGDNMVVEKKRYIESWIYISGVWRIAERIPKKEWRERQKKALATPPPEETDAPPSEPESPPSGDVPEAPPASE